MSDPNMHLNTKDGGHAPTPAQLNPPPAQGQGRTAPQPNRNPASGRMPLFRR
jgi:hypothetical protein